MVKINDYPQLKTLCWNLRPDFELSPEEALGIYERNWNFVDPQKMSEPEIALLTKLKNEHGGGVLLV